MTPLCVCSHDQHDHFSSDGMCLDFTCGCSYYEPLDGKDYGTINPRHQPYSGFYAGKTYKLGETA